jgi:hypothetical protein
MVFNESNDFIILVLYSFDESGNLDMLSNLKIVFKLYFFKLIGKSFCYEKNNLGYQI